MQQILKRLTLIQMSIELDDTDIIAMQVSKLENLDPTTEVQSILAKQSLFSSIWVTEEL